MILFYLMFWAAVIWFVGFVTLFLVEHYYTSKEKRKDDDA